MWPYHGWATLSLELLGGADSLMCWYWGERRRYRTGLACWEEPKGKKKIQKGKEPTRRNKNHRQRHLLWPHGNTALPASHKAHILLGGSDLFRWGISSNTNVQMFSALHTVPVLFFCYFVFSRYVIMQQSTTNGALIHFWLFYWQHKHQREKGKKERKGENVTNVIKKTPCGF